MLSSSVDVTCIFTSFDDVVTCYRPALFYSSQLSAAVVCHLLTVDIMPRRGVPRPCSAEWAREPFPTASTVLSSSCSLRCALLVYCICTLTTAPPAWLGSDQEADFTSSLVQGKL